jgi:hypothetical protein
VCSSDPFIFAPGNIWQSPALKSPSKNYPKNIS